MNNVVVRIALMHLTLADLNLTKTFAHYLSYTLLTSPLKSRDRYLKRSTLQLHRSCSANSLIDELFKLSKVPFQNVEGAFVSLITEKKKVHLKHSPSPKLSSRLKKILAK